MTTRLALVRLLIGGVALACAGGCRPVIVVMSPDPAQPAVAAPAATVTVAPVVGDEPPEEAGEPTPERAASAPALAAYCGGWQETWGVNEVTDVTYHDIYLVDLRGSALTFTAPGQPHYEFRRVELLADHLEVELVNPSSGMDFVIVYEMVMDPDGEAMQGVATTPERRVSIRWDRISREAIDAELGAGTSASLTCTRPPPPGGE
ncbi:MAG TPA: hypothetical protein PLU22_03690 [Polyangiaceae bacterium]|nr:hypothetical protein [Polyangiaceae bacterium]